MLVLAAVFPRLSRIAVSRMGRIKSDSNTFSNAPRTTWLMILWLSRMAHEDSRSHSPAISVLHSVSARGPSRAEMISAREISWGSRTKLYPPLTPRCDVSTPL